MALSAPKIKYGIAALVLIVTGFALVSVVSTVINKLAWYDPDKEQKWDAEINAEMNREQANNQLKPQRPNRSSPKIKQPKAH